MKKTKGFSLIEILIAVAFIAVMTLVIINTSRFSSHLRSLNQQRTQATVYAQGGLEAANLITWTQLVNGTYGLQFSNDIFSLTTTPETLDTKFTRTVTISDARRASEINGQVYGDIVETGGYIDPATKKITSSVSWTDGSGTAQHVEVITYRHSWRADRWVQTDWSGGANQELWNASTTNKYSSKNAGIDSATPGIITLTAGFIDWTQATTTATFDTAGNFDNENVVEKDGKAYLVTDNNPSGAEFYILDVQNIHAPVLLGSLDIGSGVNAVVVYDNYAYISTDDNSKEVQIINISNPQSPQFVAGVDLTGNSDALDIGVDENDLYVVQGSNLYAFVKNSPTSLQQVAVLSVGSTAKQLYLSTNFIYVATEASNSELQIFDVTTPATMYQIGRYNLSGNLKATDVFVLGSRAYVTTQNNGSGPELFAFDISNPNQPLLLGSYEAGETLYSLAIVGPYALLGTNFLNKELVVVDVSVPSSINYVSGFNLSGLILGMSANCSVIYAATSSNQQEFFIISTEITDCDYASNGMLESSTFDTGSNLVDYNWLSWSSHVPINTSIKVQIATSANVNGPWNYLGPDGTSATYYTNGSREDINFAAHHNQRYVRYRAYLESQADLQAPILEELRLSYSIYD